MGAGFGQIALDGNLWAWRLPRPPRFARKTPKPRPYVYIAQSFFLLQKMSVFEKKCFFLFDLSAPVFLQ